MTKDLVSIGIPAYKATYLKDDWVCTGTGQYREFCQNTGWYTERSEFRLWSKTTEEHCPATSGGDCCPQRPIPWLAGTKKESWVDNTKFRVSAIQGNISRKCWNWTTDSCNSIGQYDNK